MKMNPEGRESAERDDVEDSHVFETRNLTRLSNYVCIINKLGRNKVQLSMYGLAV